jgi:CoA:oxalate CoA-transferase
MPDTNSYKTDRDVLNKKRISPPQGPLAGLRVLDISQVLAAPYLGMMLSDMGAEVIKVEAPYGDTGRGWPPFREGAQGGECGYYVAQNRGKYGLAMDLTNPKAKNICMELAKISDILIENWRPGIMTRRGLGYEQIRQINPGIVYASISGFGSHGRYAPAPGPYSPRVAYDVIAQAESGYQWMNGFPDRAPHALDVPWSDMHTGTNTAVAIVAALIQKIRTGRGQWVDIALSDCMVASNENLICMVSMAADDVPAPCRSGTRRLSMTPYGVFKAKDDYLVIGVDNDKRFGRLCKALGRSELACDPRYDTNHHRLQNRRDIEKIVEDWCAKRMVDDCVRILRDEHAVPAGHILANMDYVKHPQYKAREMLVPIEQPRAGVFEVSGVVSKLSRTPGKVQGAAPLLGEHNRYILKKYLGYSDQEIDKLYDDMVIVDNIDAEYPVGVDIAKAKAKARAKGDVQS